LKTDDYWGTKSCPCRVDEYDLDYFNIKDKIFIIPIQDKPIKLIFEELPCPVCSDIRCKYAKSNLEDLIYSISCTNENKCDRS